MSLNTYYQDELEYLREVGPDFARANPEIARYLSDRGSDPDVERILEGVAFLCGRIRQKLDDELPELTASMMGLLWPHYLRPVPSMSILEFLPEIDAMQGPQRVEAGAEFASVPVAGTRCRYQSAWPAMLRPWTLRDVRLETPADQSPALVLTLQTSAKTQLSDLELGSVRLHLTGEPRASFMLYLLLSAHVEQVTVSSGSAEGRRREVPLGPSPVSALGLDRRDGVLPYPAHAFPGYRLLQEYFAFKDRFLFVDLKGLDRAVSQLELTDTAEVRIIFNRRFESYPLVSRENVRLHCVPIINLFKHPADPIRLKHDRTEYLIQPSKTGVADRWHVETFGVDDVVGLIRSESMETRRYAPFYSFQHKVSGEARGEAYYQTHLRPNVRGGDPRFGTDTYVSFVVAGDRRGLPAEETISIELTCTNRHLPEELRSGDICEPTDRSPANTRFRNVVKPTPTVCPPLGRGLHWKLISHLSLNYVSLADATHLKELLRIYDFQSAQDAQRALAHQRMLDGIVAVRSSFGERMVRGAPLRGTQVEVELNEDHFAGEGDAYLFAQILDRFLGLYVTLNSYVQLTVRFTRSGQVYAFAPRWGEQLTPATVREKA